jgi:hypothetical protein
VKNHGQKFLLRVLKHLAATGTLTLLCRCGEAEPHCQRQRPAQLIRSRRI